MRDLKRLFFLFLFTGHFLFGNCAYEVLQRLPTIINHLHHSDPSSFENRGFLEYLNDARKRSR